MRRSVFFALCFVFCLIYCGVVTAAPTPTVAPTPQFTPFVETPSPEALAAPTRAPRGWRSVGGGGFDIYEMTIEERLQLINDLNNANLLDQVKDTPVVQGLSSSRDNPVYIGQRAQFKQEINFIVEGESQMCTITMALLEVLHGEEAAAKVIEMNPLNELPPAGKEYVVALFNIGVTADDPNEMFTFTMYEFQPVNDRGKVLDYAFITDDLSMLQLYAGGEGNLRVTALVDEGTELLFRYRDTVWFSTKQFDLTEMESGEK